MGSGAERSTMAWDQEKEKPGMMDDQSSRNLSAAERQ